MSDPSAPIGGRTIRRLAVTALVASAGLATTAALAAPAFAAGSTVGTQWSLSAPAAVGTDSGFTDVTALNSSDAWAVGATHQFSTGLQTTLAEHWNGRKWTVVTTPNAKNVPFTNTNGNVLNAVSAVSPTDVWAVGHLTINNSFSSGSGSLVEHWDGRKWSLVPTPNGVSPTFNFNNDLLDVSGTAANDVWAVGWNGSAFGDIHRPTLQHWDGTKWTLSPMPALGDTLHNIVIEGVSAISRTDVWATGFTGTSADDGSPTHPLTLHWDGSTWSRVTAPEIPVPAASSRVNLNAVRAVSSTDVWAGGNVIFVDAQGNPQSQAVVEHWDGRVWSVVPAADSKGEAAIITGLAAFGPADVWAVGTIGLTQHEPLLEHWDGTRWTIVASPSTDSRGSCGLFGAVAHAGGAEAVGACVNGTGATPLAELLR